MQSEFKFFVVRYLLPVILLLFIAGWITAALFEHFVILGSNSNGAYKVNRIINQTNYAEIPILGSSRAEGSFVPSILGSHFFNYGLSGSQDDVLLFFLTEEVKKNKTTPIVINFDLDGLDSCLGDLSNFIFSAKYEPVKQLMGAQYKPIYTVPFLNYYGRYESYAKQFLNAKVEVTKVTENGGSFEKNVLSDRMFKSEINERIHGSTTFKNDKRYEKRLDSLISANPHRTFVIVFSPYHKSYFYHYLNNEGFNNYVNHLNTFKNVCIINMSHMPYPDSLYFNTSHLNYKGAQLFSRQLRDSLIAKKIID